MDAAAIIRRLESFAAVLPALTSGLSAAEARRKPPSGAWSILEIVNHLVDEERDDFRFRLELTLRDPTLPWPPSDPEAWARDRLVGGLHYHQRDLAESVARFVSERGKSLTWLRSLASPDWTRTYIHPKAGPVSAAALLASWAAHDALHIRQIAKRLYELAAAEGDVRYAGEWGA
jgi:hypothetical protein